MRRLEVRVDPLLPQRVDQRLDHAVRHRAEQVGDRLAALAERRARAPRPPRPGRRRRRCSAATFRPCHSSGITGSGGAVVRLTIPVMSSGAPGAHSRNARSSVAAVRRPGRRSGPRRRSARRGCSVELELGDDPEVAAAAAQPPEELGVLGLARVHEPAVRGDDVGADEVVAREAVLAHQPADAAAEREAGDAGRRDQAAGRREPVRLRLVVDVGPHRAAADVARAARPDRRARSRIAREVDHDPVVAGREARDAVAAAAHGDREVVAAREPDRRDHVGRAAAADDQRRPPLVVHPVPDPARLGVAVVARA